MEGAGVAPWNIGKYELVESDRFMIHNSENNMKYQMLFFHFQNVVHFTRYQVKIYPFFTFWKIDKQLIKTIYYDYLLRIEEAKTFFENKYHFLPMITSYISDQKKSFFTYFSRFFRSPIKETNNFVLRLKFSILHSIRKKEGVVDVRHLKIIEKEHE